MSENDPAGGERAVRTFALRNRRDAALVVVLEPWANEYVLEPDQALDVVEEGGHPGQTLEIEIEASHIVVWGRSGSILRACRDGEELL